MITDIDAEFKLSDRALNIKGSGIRKAFDMAANMKDVINLGLGEPDFEAPEELKMLLKMAVDGGYSHYTPNAGFQDFRAILSEKLKTDNQLEYDPDTQIISTAGAMNAIHLALLALVNPGDEVIIQDPCFVGFEPSILLAGGVPVKVPLFEENRFSLNPDEVKKRITPKTRVMIINSPHNPTGSVIPEEDMKQLARIARENNIFVISDEVYEKLVYDDHKHVSIAKMEGMKERTLTVMSFSKTYAICGWRIGYAAGPEKLIHNMVKFQQFDAVHPPAPVQKAVLFYIRRSREFVDFMKKIYVARRDFMVDRLNRIEEIKCFRPAGAFYIFLNIKNLGCTSQELADFLLNEYRIVTIPGSAFGEAGEGYIRICITVPIEQLQVACIRFEQAIQRISRQGINTKQDKI